MVKKHTSLKKKYKSLEAKLIGELKRCAPNESKLNELKRMKNHISDLILKVVRQKSIARQNRYKRRTKRLTRLARMA